MVPAAAEMPAMMAASSIPLMIPVVASQALHTPWAIEATCPEIWRMGSAMSLIPPASPVKWV
jgi:hypothetical protein